LLGYLMRPQMVGGGRRPAVIALHGCGGLFTSDGTRMSSRHKAWAELLAARGFAVLFPDSFGSRGHAALCKVRPRPVKQADRLRDVETARRWLAAQPFVDTTRLFVLGWSNGGATALRLARSKKGDGYRHIIAFYPGCRVLEASRRASATPLTIIMGAADDWTPAEPCKRLASSWGARLVLYDGAYHGFDAPNSRVRQRRGLAFTPDGSGVAHVGTHPQARASAIAEVLSIVKQ
jgi:dienelactone hydrolase